MLATVVCSVCGLESEQDIKVDLAHLLRCQHLQETGIELNEYLTEDPQEEEPRADERHDSDPG